MKKSPYPKNHSSEKAQLHIALRVGRTLMILALVAGAAGLLILGPAGLLAVRLCGSMLLLGYLLCFLDDLLSKRPFDVVRFLYFLTLGFVMAVMAPIIAAAWP